MGRKTKAPDDRARLAPPRRPISRRGFADAVAELQRKHNVNPSIIPMRVWRHLYIQGRSPQDVANRAAVSAYNTRPAFERMRKR
jgi:hypothetical protein